MPAMPHRAAGPRIEPPVSVPMPPRISPAATAAPVPLLLPAVKCSVIPRVARGWRREIKRRAAIGEFVRRQFAHQHRAGGSELLGAGSVGIRDIILQNFRSTGRRYPFGIDDVLEANRDAVQWPRVTAGHDRPFGGTCISQCAFFGEVDKGVQLLVDR